MNAAARPKSASLVHPDLKNITDYEIMQLDGAEASRICKGLFQTPLVFYCQQGNEKMVRHLFTLEGFDPNRSDPLPALYLCVWWGALKEVRLLLNIAAVDVNIAEPSQGLTPLHAAASVDLVGIANELIKHPSIEVNKGAAHSETALWVACSKGRANVAALLLTVPGIGVNMLGNNESPLYAACSGNYPLIVALLVAHEHVDVNLASGENELVSPLFIACDLGYAKIAEMLLAHSNIDPNLGALEDGTTPLIVAALRGDFAIVKMLLNHPRTDANVVGGGITALLAAAGNGDETLYNMLLDRAGTDVNKAGADGETPGILIAATGWVAGLSALLAQKPFQVDGRHTQNGRTPLIEACVHNDADVAYRLLLGGADPNAQDNSGRTPLHEVCKTNPASIVRDMLLIAGASPDRLDDDLERPHNVFGGDLALEVDGHMRPSPLQIASSSGLCSLTRHLLVENRFPPNCFTFEELSKCLQVATAAHAQKRPNCLPVITSVTLGWHRQRHHLYPVPVRNAVEATLRVEERLKRVQHDFPIMPPELWLYILAFVRRVWWK